MLLSFSSPDQNCKIRKINVIIVVKPLHILQNLGEKIVIMSYQMALIHIRDAMKCIMPNKVQYFADERGHGTRDYPHCDRREELIYNMFV